MATTPQTLPFTPPPPVQRNAAGQMVDSAGNLLQAGTISPDKTTLAGGDQGLVWGASGPHMTAPAPTAQPTQQPSPSQTPDGSSGGGIFSRIGNFLTQRGPAIGDIANHLAAGAGNYRPLQAAEAEKELEIRQQQADLQGKVAQSNLQSQALQRQKEQLDITNYQTPAQRNQAAIDLANAETRNRLSAENELGPGQVVPGSLPTGGFGQFRVRGNTATPITMPSVNGEPGAQLMSAPKLKAGTMIDTPNGTAVPYFNQYGQLDHYEHVNGVPFSAEETQNINSTSKNSIQKDANGNLVNVPESSTVVTKKSRVSPYGPQGGGQQTPGITQSPGINQPPPTQPVVPGQTRGNTATPIYGADGNPLHKPLDANATKTLGQIAGTENILNSVLPELDARVKQSPTGANSIWDAATQRAAWLEYQHAGIVPSNVDPSLAKLLPIIAQLQIVAGSPYMQGSRNFQFMKQIQQHIPNPEKDSPALMLDKAHAMLQTLPLIRKGILEGEGIQQQPAGTTPAGAANVEDDFANWQNSRTPQTMPAVPR